MNQPLLYIQAFWDKFQYVSTQLEASRLELKEFMGMVESRSKVQQKYSQNLIMLYTPKFENRPSLVGQLIKSYLNEVRKRAEQAKILSSFLMTDVVSKIKDMVDGTTNEFKRSTALGKTSDKELERLKELVGKSRSRYNKKRKELQDLCMADFLLTTTLGNSKSSSQKEKEKISQKKLQLSEINKQLNNSIDEYNAYAKHYEDSMKNIMGKYYQLEIARIKTVSDSVLNVLLSEQSSFKNMALEVTETSRLINDIDAQQELQSIANNHINKPTGCTNPIPTQPLVNFIYNSFTRLSNQELENVLEYGKSHKQIIEKCNRNQPVQEDEQTSKVVKIARIFSRAWNGQTQKAELQELTVLMENVFSRKDFVLCMQQLRIVGKFEISMGCLDCIVKVVNIVLDSCLKFKDGYTGKQIMVLVFTYYVLLKKQPQELQESAANNHSKIFLQQYVKSHSIWSQKDFWQSSFIESIYQQLRQYRKTNQQVTSQHSQNIVFNQLAYYVHNMILFAISEKEVRYFATKFIKMYNLDQARSTYIYNNIENSLKEEEGTKVKADEKFLTNKSISKESTKEEEVSPKEKPPVKTMSMFKKILE